MSATETLDRLHDAYDMRFHTRGDSPQAAQLDPEFVDSFGIVGPSPYCVERLQELSELGLDRFTIVGPGLGSDPEEAKAAREAFVTSATNIVMPVVRIDGKPIGNGAPGLLSLRLRSEFHSAAELAGR